MHGPSIPSLTPPPGPARLRPVGIALAFALACGLSACSEPAAPAVFSFVTGEVYHLRGSEREAARIGAPLTLEDAVQTGAGSAAELALHKMGALRVGPESKVRLAEVFADERIEIRMEGGRAGFFIERMPADFELSIGTPTTTASVRGTEFLAFARENGAGKIALFDGAVELQDDAGNRLTLDEPGEAELAPGQELSAELVQPLSQESLDAMEELKRLTSYDLETEPGTDLLPESAPPARIEKPAGER